MHHLKYRVIKYSLVIGFFLLLAQVAQAAPFFSWDVEDANSRYSATSGEELGADGSNSAFDTISYTANPPSQPSPVVATYTDELSGTGHGEYSIKLVYPGNEAGLQMQLNNASDGGQFLQNGTKTLYLRWYEYFSGSWAGNIPAGLKIGRWFTEGSGYISQKLVNGRCNWGIDYHCDATDNFPGFNHAIRDFDVAGELETPVSLNAWHKIEFYMVFDDYVCGKGNDCSVSSVDCLPSNPSCSGTLIMWIDNEEVMRDENFCWLREGDSETGTKWQSGWFGGNYSGSSCGAPDKSLVRYLDDFYVSTTLDRDEGEDTGSSGPSDETTPETDEASAISAPENLHVVN
jgi:hypothetical protein